MLSLSLSLSRGTFFFSIDPAALDQTICSGDNMKHDKDVESLVSSLASILAFDSP
jgi:hypothetical protein